MTIDLEQILARLDSPGHERLPPVQSWNPAVCGEIDIHIDSQMNWHHEGGRFERPALVRLLASILRKEANDYFLVTPQEKMKIRVDDVPFIILNMLHNDARPPQKVFVTNTEDLVTLESPEHWQLREYQGARVPYVRVRDDLWARVARQVFYQMIDQAEQGGDGRQFFLRSGDSLFLLGENDTA